MQNKQMFITIPNLDFSQQNGEIVAHTNKDKTISTILPSADDMRVLGAQYADFVDPILSHYKNIASIFVPGTQENSVFEKIRLATQSGVPIILSTSEFNVYKRIQESAQAMPIELTKGIAGARYQEAMAGKNKYQGFTSTGIGSMLMPFGMAALAQTKLDEAGLYENKARIEAIKESDIKIRRLREALQPTPTERNISNTSTEISKPSSPINKKVIGADPTRKEGEPAWKRIPQERKQMIQDIRRRISTTDNVEELGRLADIIETGLNSKRSDLRNDFQRILDEDIPNAFKRINNFTQKNISKPSLPKPILKEKGINNKADLTRNSKNPAAWESRGAERQEFIKQTRAAVLRSDAQQLGDLADTIKSRLENMRPDMRGPMERILNEDIPNAFNRINGDPWLNSTAQPYNKDSFTPSESSKPQKLLPGTAENPNTIAEIQSYNNFSVTEYVATNFRFSDMLNPNIGQIDYSSASPEMKLLLDVKASLIGKPEQENNLAKVQEFINQYTLYDTSNESLLGIYSGKHHKDINPLLKKGGVLGLEQKLFEETQKLTTFTGTVYRGARDRGMQVGEILTQEYLTSTSKEVFEATNFLNYKDQNVLYIIQSKTGKVLDNTRHEESEVVFRPGTQFNIVKEEDSFDYKYSYYDEDDYGQIKKFTDHKTYKGRVLYLEEVEQQRQSPVEELLKGLGQFEEKVINNLPQPPNKQIPQASLNETPQPKSIVNTSKSLYSKPQKTTITDSTVNKPLGLDWVKGEAVINTFEYTKNIPLYDSEGNKIGEEVKTITQQRSVSKVTDTKGVTHETSSRVYIPSATGTNRILKPGDLYSLQVGSKTYLLEVLTTDAVHMEATDFVIRSSPDSEVGQVISINNDRLEKHDKSGKIINLTNNSIETSRITTNNEAAFNSRKTVNIGDFAKAARVATSSDIVDPIERLYQFGKDISSNQEGYEGLSSVGKRKRERIVKSVKTIKDRLKAIQGRAESKLSALQEEAKGYADRLTKYGKLAEITVGVRQSRQVLSESVFAIREGIAMEVTEMYDALESMNEYLDSYKDAMSPQEYSELQTAVEEAKQGVLTTLHKAGVELMDAVDSSDEVDYSRMQVIEREVSADLPEGSITRTLRRGFTVKDRRKGASKNSVKTLRPIEIITSKLPESSTIDNAKQIPSAQSSRIEIEPQELTALDITNRERIIQAADQRQGELDLGSNAPEPLDIITRRVDTLGNVHETVETLYTGPSIPEPKMVASTYSDNSNKKINDAPVQNIIETTPRKVENASDSESNKFDSSPKIEVKGQEPLYENIVEFYRKQRAAIAFGISKSLQKEYDGMKRDSLEAKKQIAQYNNAKFTTVEEKRQAFNNLKDELTKKRNEAYRMAGMDPETGQSVYDQKSGGKKEKSAISGYPVNKPTQQDSYIYHAQALNYDGMITYLLQSGNEPEVAPLSEDRVKEIDRKQKALAEVEYLLNTTEGGDNRRTFEGIGNMDVKFDVNALFVVEQIDPEAGFVENHMKNMRQMARELDKVGGKREANIIKGEYALRQIEAQIQMYKNRSEHMSKFSAEREILTANKKRDEAGNLVIDSEAEIRIRTATEEYDKNTNTIIDFLEQKKRAIQNDMANGTIKEHQIRAIFEDIDVEVALAEARNIGLAEVFRSPPPGNTDPRMMTYRVMQGVHALNRLTTMVQQTGMASGDLKQQDTKMIYSTERGQTATVMAALGIVTYGGGDWDGDSYTAIFDQAQEIEKEIQKQQGKVIQNDILINHHQKELDEINAKLDSIDTSKRKGAARFDELTKRKERITKSIETRKKAAAYNNVELQRTVRTMEEKIAVGYRGMDARARKQISAYTGIDERFFVSSEDVMYDYQGNPIVDESGAQIYGLRQGQTMSADAMFVFMEQGYGLMEGVDSKRNQWLTMMNNIDIITGYKSSPDAFNDDGLLRKLVGGIVRDTDNRSVSVESPAIAMLKERVEALLDNNQSLTKEQEAFLETLKGSDSAQRAMLQQFDDFVTQMDSREAAQRQSGRLQVDSEQQAIQRRAHMNHFIGHTLIAGIQSNDTMGKFMQQGLGMTLTEGTFDMTLKTLGKAGGEVLGKTYNTIIGTTFQDAPIITYGKQLLDKTNPLYNSMLDEYQKQAEGNTERQQIIEQEADAQGLSGEAKKEFVTKKLRQEGYDEFMKYTETVQSAVTKSEGVQGFMKNIHQLLRDSIKLKGDADELIPKLEISSDKYNSLSKQITETDDEEERKELLQQRDRIIESMASELGPGPGLKSLIDLDYLTNESDRTGLTKSEYEQRFFNGTIEGSRERIESMAASMIETGALDADDMADIRSIGHGHTEESKALLKMARSQTTRNLVALVTSFRMTRTEGDNNRSQAMKEFAASHRAQLATQIEPHTITNKPGSRTQDGNIDLEAEAGQRVLDMYTGSIAKEHEGSRFNAFRQHQEALASHLGMEASSIYNDDGVTLTKEYKDNLDARAKKMGVSTEEYTLMFDHLYQNTISNISGLFGDDGQKMDQFTVMNMMRKDLARSMMDGRPPNADKAEVINESIGSEVMTTMAQLAASGKLDAQGMDMFTAMNKGVVRHLVEATNQEITYFNKKTGKHETVAFSDLDRKGQNAVVTKIVYQNMFGTTEDGSPMGYHRSTSDDARTMRIKTGQLIGNSELELREDGTLGNDLIDALDKASIGSSTGAQIEMYEAMGEEYLKETLDNESMREDLLRRHLKADGVNPDSEKAAAYRKQMAATIQYQIKSRQQAIIDQYDLSRDRHGRGYGVQNRTSFMNNINSGVIGQLAKDSSANALDLVAPLLLTAAGTAISEGNISGDQIMALGGAAFTAFQYARTGAIDYDELDPAEAKTRLAATQAATGIFKLKNAMAINNDNFGAAVTQVVVQEATSTAFNAIAAPWLSRNIAERVLGAGAAPAMSALDMNKYVAGQQLAGNLGASIISAVSSTIISGLIMNTMQENTPSLSETIKSFLPAAQAVSQVNEAIARRRAQEDAFEDFEAETDGTDDTIQEYMVLTDATYNPDNYSSIEDLQSATEIEPGSDGSLSVGLIR
jgi:molecular chaperone GrpE (heat shock protein)